MKTSEKTCWVLTEGIAGTENQCIGLAEALGISPVIKRISLRFPWKQLSPWLSFGHPYSLTKSSDRIAPPWPDILIASGRKSIGMALDIKKRSHGKTFLIQIQDPRYASSHFDMIVVPEHDPTRGDNVIVTTTSLHRVTHEKLNDARVQFENTFAPYPTPRIAVLIGGSSKTHQMTPEHVHTLVDGLKRVLKDHPKASLLMTASRRTGVENEKYLRDQLSAENIYFWDGMGDNPYFGLLAHADYIIVTEDSVSMTSEAIATGKPVYTVSLGGGTKRIDMFHNLLKNKGFTKSFTGTLEQWSYTPPHDTMRIASIVRDRLKERN